MSNQLSRRDLLKAAGVAGAAVALPASALGQSGQVQMPQGAGPTVEHAGGPAAAAGDQRGPLFFFNDQEASFVEAAVERLIPEDPEWPGAAWAGVLNFIDRQLAAAYGAGGRMYLKGPWVPEAPPEQGYQLRFTPAEVYRIGIEETRQQVRSNYGEREFWDLTPPIMDEVLKALETGSMQLPSLPSPVFFETLLANTVEGFFADPAYGGNRDMVGWRMIGFPGAYAAYLDLIELYDQPYTRPPIGMADNAARLAHIHNQN